MLIYNHHVVEYYRTMADGPELKLTAKQQWALDKYHLEVYFSIFFNNMNSILEEMREATYSDYNVTVH